ncbi:Telomere length regulation protein tel2-like protein [Thalictrum thalictroides]|uniref:Telomere length regulation protein tel2-like protein n=1 Tax=Thalictrum thalictroides TaxID=46969 RepID=A0A7J6VIH2_THATH|nr:Telomere length regulation protein tel2-like protein [Thalictrum thalictroides]
MEKKNEKEEETNQKRIKREQLETKVLEKVGETITSINEAKHVDEVICALHSLAILLFPLDSTLLSGSIDSQYRDQILNIVVPSILEIDELRDIFYRGSSFPTFSRGPSIEVLEAVLPCLSQSGSKSDDFDSTAVCINAERILVLCFLEKDGVHHMAREFGDFGQREEFPVERLKPDNRVFISRVAQQVASIPDKARRGSPAALSSHSFFKQIVNQLLAAAEERALELCDKTNNLDTRETEGTFLFVGEMFSRICRRGCADILIVEIIPRILELVRSFLSSSVYSIDPDFVQSDPKALFWMKMMEAIKDPYAAERMSEQLLRVLEAESASDIEVYWCLWIVFHRTLNTQATTRSMFVDKFLLWKIFPICCLRWILQFAVLECPPSTNALVKGQNTRGLLDRIQCMVKVWSKQEFVQSAPMEQQAYVTATVGLLMEKMSKDELEATKDVMHSILQGVSCRLETPLHLVRRMASCVALVFSKVVDPNNPLYLDDSCNEEAIDWAFGFTYNKREVSATSHGTIKTKDETRISSGSVSDEKNNCPANDRSKMNYNNKNLSDFKFVDPDEIIDPAMLNCEHVFDKDEDADASEDSEMSDSSLQPYDLSDDDTDLKRNFAQIVDIFGALRKPDDPDGVERALDVAENLVRASPDELRHVSGELVRALVQVRCSDLTVEGEEETAEEKRQKALVALLVTCPFESLDALNSLLYSANVDVSQRILILDTMTEAVQELADAKCKNIKPVKGGLISTISEIQPWFLPPSRGPPGAGPWKEVSETGTPLSWSYRYERELPLRPSQIKKGKSREWSLRSSKRQENLVDQTINKFPMYAAAFMLPAMQGFDKKRHGVDLLGADFVVLGKLIYMLGICMKCTAMHPEASALAPHFLDMLSSREVSCHVETYVRRSVLFAASCILISLHPSFVASALVEGNPEISKGLEWIRTWSLHVADSDADNECASMAMTCLQLHAELALQASRALETTDYTSKEKGVSIPSIVSKGAIRITF